VQDALPGKLAERPPDDVREGGLSGSGAVEVVEGAAVDVGWFHATSPGDGWSLRRNLSTGEVASSLGFVVTSAQVHPETSGVHLPDKVEA
jgi:hypothetical protein